MNPTNIKKLPKRFQIFERNPLKVTRNKKKLSLKIMPQKYNTTMVKLGKIFEKSRRSTVILKIIGVTPKLTKISNPSRFICFQWIMSYERTLFILYYTLLHSLSSISRFPRTRDFSNWIRSKSLRLLTRPKSSCRNDGLPISYLHRIFQLI